MCVVVSLLQITKLSRKILTMISTKSKYNRVLLKLSGEGLMGERDFGFEPNAMEGIASEVKTVRDMGVQICLVIGAGNIFRGLKGVSAGLDRSSADYMGMLATVMNAIGVQSVLEKLNVPTRVLSAIPMSNVCEPYIRRRADVEGRKERHPKGSAAVSTHTHTHILWVLRYFERLVVIIERE